MPASTDPLPIERHILDSGITVILQESRAAPVAAIQVWVDVGAADESETEGGIAHVHEHMLFKGTSRRPVGHIAAEIEGAGGEINAWTSLDATVYHVVVASRHFDTGVDVLSDAILHSAFDPDELGRELGVILEEIKRSEDNPQSRVSRALFSNAFTEHPYRRPVIGHAHVVERFTREQILQFYQANYRPDRLTVVAVGDFDASNALATIKRAFAPAQGRSAPRAARPTEPAQTQIRSAGLVDEVEETQLAVGWHGPSIAGEDLFAIDVLGVMLGSGESSRLVHRLRHELRVVNEVYAYAYTPRDDGLFVIGAALHHSKLHDTLRAVGEVVRKVQEEPPPTHELKKAQGILAADGVYQRETVEGLARRLGYWSTSVGDPSYEEKYQEGIRAVTAQDVQRVARKYLSPQGATIVA
ncbi:MAG: M16 family metallopeptidase, partial [Myxococcota bacterium]